MIGLDNNKAERAIRGPVVTRKNARGSHNDDSARLAATVWTVTATAQMAGLNVLTYLTAYLDACGRNNGKPLSGPRLERFLPWNADPEDLRTWAQPPPPQPHLPPHKHAHPGRGDPATPAIGMPFTGLPSTYLASARCRRGSVPAHPATASRTGPPTTDQCS